MVQTFGTSAVIHIHVHMGGKKEGYLFKSLSHDVPSVIDIKPCFKIDSHHSNALANAPLRLIG